MTPSVPELLGEVRALTNAFKTGNSDSLHAFKDLASLLVRLTIGVAGSSPRLTYERGNRDQAALGGMDGPQDPLCLSDGRYLKLVIFLHLVDTENGRRLKVRDSSYQYQLDRAGDDWIFRYDYERNPVGPHPSAHFHVRGHPSADCLPRDLPLERIHFPTLRVSLEGILRLIIGQFGAPTAEPPEIWEPVLTESERLFAEIAHQPLPGT